MAKGLRASVTKRNKSKLRARVFGPVEAARTERLSAKLMELVRQPKPTRDAEMLQVDGQDVADEKSTEDGEKDQAAMGAEDMDIDAGAATAKVKPTHSSSSKQNKKGKGRVEKKRHRKEKNNITFKTKKPRRTRDKIGRA